MNITNQTYAQNTTSFKAIQPEIMQNLGKYPRVFRENIWKSYNVLQNSEILDLILDKEGNVVLKTKKELHNIIKSNKPIPEGTELYEETIGKEAESSTLDCTCISKSNGFESQLKLNLDFGSSENAEQALAAYGKQTCRTSFLPMFGVLIDAAYKLNKPLVEMKQAFEL